MEDRKSKIVLKEEELWRLKSRALCLQQGDNNTIFFHKFASFRKNVNTIWEIDLGEGNKVKSSKEIKDEVVLYFQALFKDPGSNEVIHQLEVVKNYPRMIQVEEANYIGRPVTH